MKVLVIGLVLIVLAVAGIAFYFINQAPATPSVPNVQTQPEDKIVIEDTKAIDSVKTIGSGSAQPTFANHGFYEFYSQDAFGGLTGKKVLFFYASWCPECKKADEDFKTNINKIPEDVHIFKIHYNDPQTFDEDKEFAQRYGITYQHTFVQIDDEGKEITKWNGGGLDKLLSSIK